MVDSPLLFHTSVLDGLEKIPKEKFNMRSIEIFPGFF